MPVLTARTERVSCCLSFPQVDNLSGTVINPFGRGALEGRFLSLLRWSDQSQRQDVLGLPAVEVRRLRCTNDGEVRRHGGEVLASIFFSPVSLNRRAVRAKVVSPVALTYFHRFRSRLDGPVPRQVQQLVGPAGYLVQVGVVAHSVRACRHVVP